MHVYFMNNDWKEISRNREMSIGKFGITIIRPRSYDDPYPLDCPICKFLIKGLEDIYMLDKFACCQECAFTWAQPRRHEWEEGWRPTLEQINDNNTRRLEGIK